MSANNEEKKEDVVLSDRTSVRIGVVVLICGAIWWAAGVQADLNSIKAAQIAAATRAAQFEGLDARVKILEMYGSPQAQQLDKRIEKLEKDFDLHKAVTLPQPK